LIDAPEGFDGTLGRLPTGVAVSSRPRRPLDVIVFFTTSHAKLARRFEALAQALDPAGGLWIAWPKQSSTLDTDLSQNAVMEVGLASLAGRLVDNKVCAIDEDWSGLRFVVRTDHRTGWPTAAKAE
jgi:hypothetical protein